MVNYIIQVMLFQILFLVVYDLFLSKETFFQKNRFYLLATPILSFLLPSIKIPTFQNVVATSDNIIFLPEIILSPQNLIEKSSWYTSINYFEAIFLFGAFIFLVIFTIKLIKIIRLIKLNKVESRSAFKLIFLPNKTKAFSFFRYIFLGKEIPKSQQEKIIEHEIVHSKQKHSADLLFFELLKIVMWFNPMLYFYQQRIAIVHEYIADDFATKNSPKESYINNLLSEVFMVENISFINQFYKHSFLKKRIIMMTKEKSKQVKQLKYLVLIPVLASMLFYTACTQEKIIEHDSIDEVIELKEEKEIIEVVEENINNSKNYELKTDDGEIIEIVEERIIEEVPFSIIENAPTFPGCEKGDRKCFNKMIKKHFVDNFDTSLPNKLNLESGRNKIFVKFKIDKNGNVKRIEVEAPHQEINDEVIKIMESLPKMIPGEQRGTKVDVKYAIPFVILVE